MPYNEGLTAYQWAREAVAGTDLAATSKALVETLNFTPASEFYRPAAVRGLVQRNRGFETAAKRFAEFAAEGPVSYEQLQNWLCMSVVNVATPTGAGPYVWEHIRNPAALPTLATFTFERRETDGATPIDHAWHYALARQLTLSFADGEPLKLAVNGFARRVQTETLTASLSL